MARYILAVAPWILHHPLVLVPSLSFALILPDLIYVSPPLIGIPPLLSQHLLYHTYPVFLHSPLD